MGYFTPVDELIGGAVLAQLSVVLPGYSSAQNILIPAAGATVYVYQRGTTTQVPVYTDQHGAGAASAQPLTTDASGRVIDTTSGGRVYVQMPQELDVNLSGAGLTPTTIPVGNLQDQAVIADPHVVASDAAMLAIPGAHEGTVAIRTDLNRAAFIHNGGTAGTDADWDQIAFGDVESVNGHTGVVVLAASDVGALPAGTTLDQIALAAANVNLNGKKITNLADATAGTDGLNLETGDARYSRGLTTTALKSAAYAASAYDFVPVDVSTAPWILTLPTAPANGTRVGFRIVKGSVYALTLAVGAGDVFDIAGGLTQTLVVGLGNSGVLRYSSGVWYIESAAGNWGSSGALIVTNNNAPNRVDVTDGVMASGSTGLACTTSLPFGQVQAMINAGFTVLVKVAGAGNAAGTLDLCTRAVSETDTGHLVLNAPCANTSGVSGATVSFGPDWTNALQSAMNSTTDVEVRVPSGRDIMYSSLTPTDCTLNLSGVTWVQSTPLNTAAVTNVVGNSDRPIINRFRLYPGIAIGTGNEQQNNEVCIVSNIVDCTVRDGIVLNYQAAGFYFTDCQRCTISDTTQVTNGSTPGAVNYIVVLYALNGTAANAPQEFICTRNYVLAPNGSADAIGISSSNVTNSNAAFPIDTIIANNDFTVKSTPIGIECGGTGAPVFYFNRAVIANNICNCTRTTASRAIYIRDDSTGGSSDPLLISDVIVISNVIYTLCGGIEMQASRGIIGWNIVRQAGTASSNNAIALTPHGSANPYDNIVIGNIVSAIDGQTGTNIYALGQVNAFIANNLVKYDTGATGSTDAIMLQNCRSCTTAGNIMRNLPGRGVRFVNCRDTMSDSDRIFNPCIASGNAGFFFDNTGSGYYIVASARLFGGLSAPAAPTVTASGTTGTATAGTYLVKITYVNSAGETSPSSEVSVTITLGQNIVISSPNSDGNASGWYAYVTQQGGATGTETRQQAAGSPTAIGTALTLAATPTNTGAAPPASNTSSKMTFCINNQGTTASAHTDGKCLPIGGVGTGNVSGSCPALTTF